MLENVLKMTVDTIFPPPSFSKWPNNKKHLIPEDAMERNRFELIFDEKYDDFKGDT